MFLLFSCLNAHLVYKAKGYYKINDKTDKVSIENKY